MGNSVKPVAKQKAMGHQLKLVHGAWMQFPVSHDGPAGQKMINNSETAPKSAQQQMWQREGNTITVGV